MHRIRIEAIVAAAARYEAAVQDEAAAEDASKRAQEAATDAQRRIDEATVELDRLTAEIGSTAADAQRAVDALHGLLEALPFDIHGGQLVVTGVQGGGYEYVREPGYARQVRERLAEEAARIVRALAEARKVVRERDLRDKNANKNKGKEE